MNPVRKKIAVILSRFPYPLDKGDRLRAFHQLKYLSQYHDLYVHALYEGEMASEVIQEIEAICTELYVYRLNRIRQAIELVRAYLKGWPVQCGYFYSPYIDRKIKTRIEKLNPDVVYCQLSRTGLYGLHQPFYKVIDLQDAFSLNYQRMQEGMYGFRKWFYRREARSMRQFEEHLISRFDAATIISAFDKEALGEKGQSVVVIPNGVETSFFTTRHCAKVYDVVFCGNLNYIPNREAALYLIKQLKPILVNRIPGIRISIAGSGGSALKDYGDEHLVVSDWVDDIRDVYDAGKLFVAPLFSGAGLQNKLLEAMSMGMTCITTPIVNASLQAREKTDLFIASSPDEFVEAIVGLLQDTEGRMNTGQQARKFVEEKYSWNQANAALARLLTRS